MALFTLRVGNRSFSPIEVFDRYIRAVVASYAVEARMRVFPRKPKEQITFFGHSLDGNLMAFAQYLAKEHPGISLVAMTDTPQLYRQLKHGHAHLPVRKVVSSQAVSGLLEAAKSKAVLTSHGPISLKNWQDIPKNKRPLLVDVGHGIGYKGKIAKGYQKMLRYDHHFVSSELSKDFVARAGVSKEDISVLGYARTDKLVGLKLSKKQRRDLLKSYDFSPNETRKIVLYAPTWDEKEGNNIYPFGMSGDDFFKTMNDFAKKNDCLVIFRPHINTRWELSAQYSANLRLLSARDYPIAETLLQITDVLITDWSSIFAEYLALKRPVIFIDKEPSFGTYIAPLTLEDRPGAVVKTMDEFTVALAKALKDPQNYLKAHQKIIAATTSHAWSETLDGKSAERYFDTIQTLLKGERFTK